MKGHSPGIQCVREARSGEMTEPAGAGNRAKATAGGKLDGTFSHQETAKTQPWWLTVPREADKGA